ncbi:hypothetical protein [Streptomyces sp. NPDC058861]|uniref:hypothetical protein n=1 Tax=Streptomyces sp. NPDC058861 TaxID=3346653 RepID=UPI0036A679EA
MTSQTFSKVLADGRTARVTPFLTVFGDVSYEAVDGDGHQLVSGWLQDAAASGVREERRPEGCTHLIAGLPALWFTAEEAAALTAIGDAAKAAFDASEKGQQLVDWRARREAEQQETAARTAILRTPEGQALVRQREQLKSAAAAVLDADDAQRARAHDDEGGDPGMYYRHQQPQNLAAHERALDALREFDTRHPQIAAALKEERDAAVRRALDID